MLRSQLKLKHPSQHRAGGAARRRNALQADIAPRAPVLCIKSTPSPTNTGASRYEIDSNLSVRALRSNLESAPSAQPLRTYYLYAEEGLIAESTQAISLNTDGSVTAGAAPQITTQYGPRPDSDFTTGVLFVKTNNSNNSNNSNNQASFAYLHHDHLQTPLQATDKAGNVVWAASYNAFGKAAITTPAATADKPTINLNLRLPGQYLDEETGLHYNWHRYYDADTGRYTQNDPIGLDGGLNRYVYVDGSPTMLTDPLGLFGMADMPTAPQAVVDFGAGLGDALLLGTGSYLRDAAGVDGGVDECSDAYLYGSLSSAAFGGARLAYSGLAKAGSVVATSGAAASEFRQALKVVFRGGVGRNWRPPNLAGKSDASLRQSAGKTNAAINSYGAGTAAAAGIGASKCGCPR